MKPTNAIFFSIAKEILVKINIQSAISEEKYHWQSATVLWATGCEFGGGGCQFSIDFCFFILFFMNINSVKKDFNFKATLGLLGRNGFL